MPVSSPVIAFLSHLQGLWRCVERGLAYCSLFKFIWRNSDRDVDDKTQASWSRTFCSAENVLMEEECGNLHKAFDTLGEAYYGMKIQCREK